MVLSSLVVHRTICTTVIQVHGTRLLVYVSVLHLGYICVHYSCLFMILRWLEIHSTVRTTHDMRTKGGFFLIFFHNDPIPN